jgi:hypothetical protein
MPWKNSTGGQTKSITDMPIGTYKFDFHRLSLEHATPAFVSVLNTYMRNKYRNIDAEISFKNIPSLTIRDISLCMGKELVAG